MRAVVVTLGVALVGLVGWMLFELRTTPTPPAASRPVAVPAPSPSAVSPPLPIGAPPPSRPTASPTPSPSPSTPGSPPPSSEDDDPAPTPNPMDQVLQGKTRREWRHYYGERQRAIQDEMLKYEEILDGAEKDPQAAATAADARARIAELRQRLRDDLTDLRKIEGSP